MKTKLVVNTVPSLDNKDIRILRDFTKHYIGNEFRKLEDKLNLILQNGVETTKEQPKISLDLKIQIMKLMDKHVELRNSDDLTNRNLYHKFLDWEKEVYKII